MKYFCTHTFFPSYINAYPRNLKSGINIRTHADSATVIRIRLGGKKCIFNAYRFNFKQTNFIEWLVPTRQQKVIIHQKSPSVVKEIESRAMHFRRLSRFLEGLFFVFVIKMVELFWIR